MSSTLLSNRYQILETLGAGGFGTTLLAEDIQMPSRRKCVIKQLKPIENNPDIYRLVQERFHREAAILENLGNVNGQIPQLYAYFNEDDRFYLIQEWIEGVTLSQKVRLQGRLPETQVRSILMSLLSVLDYVHSRQIIHRDIKPDNIILRSQDQKPVLIDFGAVRETMGTVVNSEGEATSSIVIGTPGFMPSEQAAGRAIYSSDLYSLGLTMIYLLTGKPPQDLDLDPRTGDVVWQHDAPGVNQAFIDSLNRSIQYNPRDRYATAAEMLDALEHSGSAPGTAIQAGAIRDRLPGASFSEVPPTVIPSSSPSPPNEFMESAVPGAIDSMAVGKDKPMPPEVPGWNWGAFLLPGIWCLNNQVWWGLLAWTSWFTVGLSGLTVGLSWLVVGGLLGAKGNEWAWKSRGWKSVEAFQANQRAWAIGGIATWGSMVGLIILLVAIGSQLPDTNSTVSNDTTPEPTLPDPPVPPTEPTPPPAATEAAGLTNLQVCALPEPDTVCDGDRAQIPTKTPSILVSADLDVPMNTEINITWRYLGGEAGDATDIDTISVVKDNEAIDYVWTRLPAPESGAWPTGDYRVDFEVLRPDSGNDGETIQKSFSIQ
ncbi:MAG: serine/threonine protein kinase [Leptolyngbya sp. DLM2.Bin15]|nr:MAG: serine/threonine protein kinase [Leptolyngbya sp. DLM2.Bin15]